jgi:hypothetical protein
MLEKLRQAGKPGVYRFGVATEPQVHTEVRAEAKSTQVQKRPFHTVHRELRVSGTERKVLAEITDRNPELCVIFPLVPNPS